MTRFNRVWAMPSKDTFSIVPIAKLIRRVMMIENRICLSEGAMAPKEVCLSGDWIDPFARDSQFNEFCIATNDLNQDTRTTHHLESLDFLKLFPDESVDGILFDPPYSPRQISECYKSVGREVHMEDTQSSFYGDRKKEVARILRKGGIAICCGWNSGGIGLKNGFELEEVLLVPHGGAHNDTIVTVERKIR